MCAYTVNHTLKEITTLIYHKLSVQTAWRFRNKYIQVFTNTHIHIHSLPQLQQIRIE